jgi:hypothetical protein
MLAALGATLSVAIGHLLWPAISTYRRLRGARLVACPETGAPAAVELDPLEAAATVAMGRETVLRVIGCSRWPEHLDCAQHCRAEIAAAARARAPR